MAAVPVTRSSTSGPTSRPGGRRRHRGLDRPVKTIIAFLAPAMIAIILLRLLPFGGAVRSSLYVRDGVGLLAPERFAGLHNFAVLFGDEYFVGTLIRTLIFNLVINPVQIACAMAVALLLTQRLPGRGLWRTAVFIPCTIPMVGSSIAWGIALRQDGPINAILGAIGIGEQPFFSSPTQALPSIMLVASWIGIGYWMLFLIGGLNDVNAETYEAAKIDGASAWQTLWRITIPQMRRPLLFVLVADTVANFVLFIPVQMLTNGGPESSTTLLMFDAYRRTYTYSQPNLGAAATLVLIVIMLIIVAVQFRLLRERD